MYYHSFTFVLQDNIFVLPVIYVPTFIYVCSTHESSCSNRHSRLRWGSAKWFAKCTTLYKFNKMSFKHSELYWKWLWFLSGHKSWICVPILWVIQTNNFVLPVIYVLRTDHFVLPVIYVVPFIYVWITTFFVYNQSFMY